MIIANFGNWDRISSEKKRLLPRAVSIANGLKANPDMEAIIRGTEMNHTNGKSIDEILRISREDVTLAFDFWTPFPPWSSALAKHRGPGLLYFKRSFPWTAADLAITMLHEELHDKGFGHEKDWTPARDFTVNYTFEFAAHDVLKKLGYQMNIKGRLG